MTGRDAPPVVNPTDVELSIWERTQPRRTGGLVRTKAHVFKDCVDWDEFYREPDRLKPEDWESKMLAGFRGEWFAHVLEDSERILDVGCGFGFPTFYLARCGHEVVGVDASPSEIDTARRIAARMGSPTSTSFEVIEQDRLPFADRSFDGASFCTSLECAGDAPSLLKEVRRVLRPGSPIAIEEEDRSLGPQTHPVWERLRWASFEDTVWLWYETRIREPYLDRRYVLRTGAPDRVRAALRSAVAGTQGLPVVGFEQGGITLEGALSLVADGEWSEARGYDPSALKMLLEEVGFSQLRFWLKPDGRRFADSLEKDGLLGEMPGDVRAVLRAIVRSTETTDIPVTCVLKCISGSR